MWLNHPRILAFIKAQNTENYSYAEAAAAHPYNFVVEAPVTPGILPDQLGGGGTLPAPLDNISKRKNGDRTPSQQEAYERKLTKNRDRKRAKKLERQTGMQMLQHAEDRNNEDGVSSDDNNE